MILCLVNLNVTFSKSQTMRPIALEAFKIVNNQTPVYLSDILTYFMLKNIYLKPHCYSFSNTYTVEIPQLRTSSYGVRSFRSTAAKIWNSLPQKFQEITSTEQFRSRIGTWSGGGGGLHMLVFSQTVNAYVLFSVAFNVISSV